MTAIQYRSRRLARAVLATSIAALCAVPGHGQFEISTATGNTAQDFNTLSMSGTAQPWTNDTTVVLGDSTLNGWSLFTYLNGAITDYNAGDGGSNAGHFYSFGTALATDRALGGTASGNTYFGNPAPASGAVAGYLAFAATNTSSATLTSFTVGFDGEQWRNGGNTNPQTMVLQYGFGADFSTITWSTPGGNFDWASPVVGATGAAVDGNVLGLDAGRGGTINGLDWTTGQTLWVRWIENNDTGNDHGLAIDNFAFSWAGATIVPLYWDTNGATAGIGGTGVWSATNVANVNWNPNAAGDGTPQNSDASKRLIFGGAGGVITIDTSVAANIGMEFDASYTLNGGVLTLGSISTIDVDGTVTINSALAGIAGLTKLGPGTLILTNATNPLEGTISISAGGLSVGADGHLGNANNDIVLSGGLRFSNGFALAAGRNLTGSGALRIPAGQTVTTQGTVNLSSVELSSGDVEHDDGGAVALNGASNTLGNVTLADPVVITSPSGINVSGNVTVNTGVIGASRITAPVTLTGGAQKFTILDGPAAVDFLIDGVMGGTGKLHKVGPGTLRLTGVNTAFPGGVRIGTAGSVSVQEVGGRLIIGDKNALGTQSQFEFNDGTLETEGVLTGADAVPLSVSLGAGQQGPATFTGMPVEFTGDLSLFKPALTTIDHKLQLEADVTFRGFAASQGTGTSTGLLVSGLPARSLTFSGTAATPSTETLNLDGPTLVVNGALTGATVNVRAGTLRGPGPLGGILTIGDGVNENDATLEPGTGVGTMTIGGMFLLSDARVRLELDLTALTADKLMADGPVDLGIGVASVDFVFLNPTTVPLGTVFTLIDNTPFGTTGGAFDGFPDGTVFNVAGNQFQIDYTAGPDFNDVVLNVIPEPSAAAFLALGTLALGARRRRENVTTG